MGDHFNGLHGGGALAVFISAVSDLGQIEAPGCLSHGNAKVFSGVSQPFGDKFFVHEFSFLCALRSIAFYRDGTLLWNFVLDGNHWIIYNYIVQWLLYRRFAECARGVELYDA